MDQAEFSTRVDAVSKGILFTYLQKITLKNGSKKTHFHQDHLTLFQTFPLVSVIPDS